MLFTPLAILLTLTKTPTLNPSQPFQSTLDTYNSYKVKKEEVWLSGKPMVEVSSIPGSRASQKYIYGRVLSDIL